MGHTRWATHGKPSETNAHPHLVGDVAVVHNGIIENYLELKEALMAKGCRFTSQTDTEVVAHLLDYYYEGDTVEALRKAINRMRGSYALGILCETRPDEIIVVRKDSPLIVGLGEGENFVASDIPAILKYTRRYYLLDDNEIAVVTRDDVAVYGLLGERVEKQEQLATWDTEAAEKGGYEHFMLKEIFEQPKALRDTILPRIKDGMPSFNSGGDWEGDLSEVCRIHIVACGSAMHVGMAAKYIIENLARVPVEVDVASEFRYRSPVFMKGALALIISQSGETADTIAAMRLAKAKEVGTLAIVNVVGSSIAREADGVLYTFAGPEIAVATTKAYSAQLAVIYLFALRLAYIKGTMTEKEVRDATAVMAAMPAEVEKMLSISKKCQYIASRFQNAHDLFFIGRGVDYALSMEGSLKLKEISYMHSEAYAAGELKHGTISLIVQGMPVVALATQTPLVEKIISNIKEVRARGANVLLLCRKGCKEADSVADYVLRLPELPDIFMPLAAVVPLQLFAYYTAVLRGCDVDKPRNLAKSVTVE
jgi:glucosamine--fructose-6-phosphate aminotransferase (isomerizing)